MIVATAGHVDHGKTLLVKALTGVDTDRLPEEKKRGLTIDLGFAYYDLGGFEPTGFVDVPGHERFIRTMLAGVSGIDYVVFVVAADDGPMPQTAEHLAIMDFLEIDQGIIALTKIDRVPQERVEAVSDELTTMLANTSLAQAPIVPVSAMENIGIDTLRDAIAHAAKNTEARPTSGNFRLAIDRSFILSGAGRVVTGTVFSGRAAVGDSLYLAPERAELRVREIHAQNEMADVASAGQRCALNVVGGDLRRSEISRGTWLVAEPACFGVTRFDAQIRILNDETRAFKNRTPVHVHVGAADVTGRVVTLEGPGIEPGDSGLVQIQLDKPIATVRGDHVILRDQSALRTVGGGIVLDPLPQKKRSINKQMRLDYLRAQNAPNAHSALDASFGLLDTVSLSRFQQAWNLTQRETQSIEAQVPMKQLTERRERVGVRPEKWQAQQDMVRAGLEQWHKQNADRAGINEAELRPKLAERISPDRYHVLLEDLLTAKHIVREGALIRLPQHQAVTSNEDQAQWDKISKILSKAGAKPPVVHDLSRELGMPYGELNKFLMKMARDGHLVRVSDKRFFMPQVMRDMVAIVEALLANDPKKGFYG